MSGCLDFFTPTLDGERECRFQPKEWRIAERSIGGFESFINRRGIATLGKGNLDRGDI